MGYLCNQRTWQILANNPFVDKIFPLSRGDLSKIFRRSKIAGLASLFSLIKDIKKYKFDCAIDLSLEQRCAFMLKLLGIKKRIGFDFKGRGRFLTEKIKINSYCDKHIVEYYSDLLRLLGIDCKDKHLEIYTSDTEKSWAKGWLKRQGISENALIIGICPGGGLSWGKQKIFKLWGIDKFAALSDMLVEELGAKVIVFGDEADNECVEQFLKKVKHNIISCCAKLSLREFVSLLSYCKLSVTNDGGALHVAAAAGIRTVSIFGPVDEKVYGPYPYDEDRHLVVKRYLDCQPCYKNFRITDCSNRKCLEIETQEVFEAVKKLLFR